MEYKIFLASSSELKDDRVKFEAFITELNKYWHSRGVNLDLIKWEDGFIDTMTKDGLQSLYNNSAADSDVFVMLFFTKVGPYTAQEFEAAFKNFEGNRKPLIYTYFKDNLVRTGEIGDEIISMLEFKKKLRELKHYTSVYSDIEDLKWKFSRQLEQILNSLANNISSLTNKSQIDTKAIENVCKLLSPQSDENIISELKLPELIARASGFGKNAVFQLAKVNRRSNRDKDRNLMARSIPIFEALILSSKRREHHEYFGQLGYALKDQEISNWEEAEENFNIAIGIRAPGKPEYFYEFNRAICKINIDKKYLLNEPSDVQFQELILQDLSYVKKGLGNEFQALIQKEDDNRRLAEWLKVNAIGFDKF